MMFLSASISGDKNNALSYVSLVVCMVFELGGHLAAEQAAPVQSTQIRDLFKL